MSDEHEPDITRQRTEVAVIEAIYPAEFFAISAYVSQVLSPFPKFLTNEKIVYEFWASISAQRDSAIHAPRRVSFAGESHRYLQCPASIE